MAIQLMMLIHCQGFLDGGRGLDSIHKWSTQWIWILIVISTVTPMQADVEDLPILASPDSLVQYKAATLANPKDAVVLAKLGHAYLALDSLSQAERQFHRSIKIGKRPEAYYGLALSYWFRAERDGFLAMIRVSI